MPRVVFFDELGTPQKVTRVTGPSFNEGSVFGQTDVVIDPDLSLLAVIDGAGRITSYLVEQRYWKHETGAIVTMTAGEIAAQDAAEAAAEDAAIRAGAKDERHETEVLQRAGDQALRDRLNLLHRHIRQLTDAIADSSGSVANLKADVAAWRTATDLTNVSKAEWNSLFDTKVDAIVINDPTQDPD